MVSLAWMILQRQQPISANLSKPHRKMKAPHPDLMGQAIKFRSVMDQPVGRFNPDTEDSADADLGGISGSYGGTC